MTNLQKAVKYLAIAFAIFLAVSIICGILSVVGLISGMIDSDPTVDEVKEYAISQTITGLDIQINAADFSVRQSDRFALESNLKHLTVKEKDGTLLIEEKKRFGAAYHDAVLTLYIPQGTVFDEVSIITGAGRLTADTLSAASLSLVLGAGQVSIDTLTATARAEIEGGAGMLTVSGGSLRDLDLAMGVGQLNLTAALLGSCELELGVGESNLTLLGAEADYGVEIEKGLGNITVDGKEVSHYTGSGPNRVALSGGVGAVNLVFKELT